MTAAEFQDWAGVILPNAIAFAALLVALRSASISRSALRLSEQATEPEVTADIAPIAGTRGWLRLDYEVVNRADYAIRLDRLDLLMPRAAGMTTDPHRVDGGLHSLPSNDNLWTTISLNQIIGRAGGETLDHGRGSVFLRIAPDQPLEDTVVVLELRLSTMDAWSRSKTLRIVRWLMNTTSRATS
jgi:hypothetical protein